MSSPAHVRWTRPIWAALGRLKKLAGFDRDVAEDILRSIVLEVSGQSSTKKLSPRQARDVLAVLNERADAQKAENVRKERAASKQAAPKDEYRATTRAGRSTENDDAMVTREQSEALLQLAGLLGWSRAQLRGWIGGRMRHVCNGAPWPQKVGQARKLHEGLEAMVMRRPENEPLAVLRRVQTAWRAPGLTAWESKFLRSMVVDQGELELWNHRQTMKYRSWKRLVKLSEIEHSRLPKERA